MYTIKPIRRHVDVVAIMNIAIDRKEKTEKIPTTNFLPSNCAFRTLILFYINFESKFGRYTYDYTYDAICVYKGFVMLYLIVWCIYVGYLTRICIVISLYVY